MADSSKGSAPGNLPFADDAVSKSSVPNPFAANSSGPTKKQGAGNTDSQKPLKKQPVQSANPKSQQPVKSSDASKPAASSQKTVASGAARGNQQKVSNQKPRRTPQSKQRKPAMSQEDSGKPVSVGASDRVPISGNDKKQFPQKKHSNQNTGGKDAQRRIQKKPGISSDPDKKPIQKPDSVPARPVATNTITAPKKPEPSQKKPVLNTKSEKTADPSVDAALSKIASISDTSSLKKNSEEQRSLDVTPAPSSHAKVSGGQASSSNDSSKNAVDAVPDLSAAFADSVSSGEKETAPDAMPGLSGDAIPQPFGQDDSDSDTDMPFDTAAEGEEFLKSLGDVDLGGADRRTQIIRILSGVAVVVLVVALIAFGVYAFNRWVRPSFSGLSNGDSNDPVEQVDPVEEDVFDADGDGLPDEWELEFGLDPEDGDDAFDDDDFDQLNNSDEYRYGTSPINPDTDGDTFRDGVEIQQGFNPTGDGRIPERDPALKKAENLRDVVAEWNGIMNGKNLSSQDLEFFFEDTGEIIGTFNLQNLEGEQIFSRGRGEFTYNKSNRLFTAELSVKGFRNQEGIDYTLIYSGLVQPDLNKITGTWTLIPSREVPWLLRDRGTFQMTK